MAEKLFLTAAEVSDRYRGLSEGTLANWRVARVGPPFLKIGKAVLYPVQELNDWDQANLVHCNSRHLESKKQNRSADDAT